MSSNKSPQCFTRSERVLRRADFERVYSSGFRTQSRFMIVFVAPNGGSRARLGVAATRKLGPAVDRNRAKRLAREVFRRHKILAGLDVVVVPRRDMLEAPFSHLEADYVAALAKRESRTASALPRRPAHARGARKHPRV